LLISKSGRCGGRALDFCRDDLPVDFIIESFRPCRSNSLNRNDERHNINSRMILLRDSIASRADCHANLEIQAGVTE
jgi:hypothetical protein